MTTTMDLKTLDEQVAGDLMLPDDPGFPDARRVWNGMIDRHPTAILRATSVPDVSAGLHFAQEHALPIAVRGGGHGVAGHGTVESGLVIDLGRMSEVAVDEDASTVSIAGGARLRDVDRATVPYGLAAPLGVVGGTGVAGLTLGGGVGWLTRAHGLSIDNLVSAEVVTASGDVVTASEEENGELFWGLRGGGGNFGVVTSLDLRAHRLPESVYCGTLVYDRTRWAEALRGFELWSRDAPDTVTVIITFLTPPEWMGMGGDPLMLLGFAWAGDDVARAAQTIDDLRLAAPPDAEEVAPVNWVEWQSAIDDLVPDGVRAYWKNTSFDRLDEEVIEVIVRRAGEQTWTGTAFDIHLMGGAYGRVPEDATAFPSRSARFWLNVYGFWDSERDDEARIAFVRGFAADMEPFSSGGQYINFMGHEDADRPTDAAEIYGRRRFERLVALKRRYDPANLFRLNHNIAPDGAV